MLDHGPGGALLLRLPVERATASDPVKTPGKRCPYLFNATTKSGRDIVVHTPGLMLGGYISPGRELLVQAEPQPRNATRHSTHSVLAVFEDVWIGANPYLANNITRQAIAHGLIPGVDHLKSVESEFKIGHHRYDFYIDGRPIEVKSSSFAFDGVGVFPVQLLSDVARGRPYKEPTSTRFVSQVEHLSVLERGLLLIVVQRPDCDLFCINPLDTITADIANNALCAKVAIKVEWALDAEGRACCRFAGLLEWVVGSAAGVAGLEVGVR